MCTAKYVTMDKEGLEDRAYRLYYNEGQNRTDLFVQVRKRLGCCCLYYEERRIFIPVQSFRSHSRPLSRRPAVGGRARMGPHMLFSWAPCAQVASVFGAAAAALLLGPTAANIAGGASFGSAAGVLAHVVTRPKDDTPNKMVHELKTP
jgi:hypothetical protein